LLRYHENGLEFWRAEGVHHPFLLPQYREDGRRYHQRFAKIGFQPSHADLVSFVELMHLPTVGRSDLTPQDLNAAHLQSIGRAILHGSAQYIFLSSKAARLMGRTGLFPQLNRHPRTTRSGTLGVLFEDEKRTFFRHLHFSNYGKYEQRLQAEAKEIAALVPDLAQTA
jgi:hypothetical protein